MIGYYPTEFGLMTAWSLDLGPNLAPPNQCRLFVINIASLPYAHDVHLVFAMADVEMGR